MNFCCGFNHSDHSLPCDKSFRQREVCNESPACSPCTPNSAGSPISAGCFLFLSDSDFDPDTGNLLQLGPSAVRPRRVRCLFVLGPLNCRQHSGLWRLALLVQTRVDTWTPLIRRNGIVFFKFLLWLFLNTFDCMNVHCVISPPSSKNKATVVLSRPVSPIAQNICKTKELV